MDEVEKWVKSLQRIINKKPKGIELIISYTDIAIYSSGTYDRHVMSNENGFGIKKESIFNIPTHGKGIIPYSEGT